MENAILEHIINGINPMPENKAGEGIRSYNDAVSYSLEYRRLKAIGEEL